MIGKLALLASLAWVAACAPATEETAQEGMATPELPVAANGDPGSPSPAIAPRAPAELIPARELIGEWRVAGVDGEAIDQPYAITASIDADRIHVVADCVNLAWSYAAESGTIETRRVPVEGCGRGLTASEEAIVAALDSATGFRRTPANAIEIFSQDHRVTLFSQ